MTDTLRLEDLDPIKQRQQGTWSSGDYAVIGTRLQIVGESLCEAVDVNAGWLRSDDGARAYIELAEASGLSRVEPGGHDPAHTPPARPGGHIRTSTRPTTRERGTGPKVRESTEFERRSPITNTLPLGTRTGPK